MCIRDSLYTRAAHDVDRAERLYLFKSVSEKNVYHIIILRPAFGASFRVFIPIYMQIAVLPMRLRAAFFDFAATRDAAIFMRTSVISITHHSSVMRSMCRNAFAAMGSPIFIALLA